MTIMRKMNLNTWRVVFALLLLMTIICLVCLAADGRNKLGHFRLSRVGKHAAAIDNGVTPGVMRSAVKATAGESRSSTVFLSNAGHRDLANISSAEPEFSRRSVDKQGAPYRQYSGTVASQDDRAESVYMHIKKGNHSNLTYHSLSKEDPYRVRLVNIQRQCKLHPAGIYSTLINLNRLIYDDRHKVIMCVIPKTACTTWKTLMYYLMGRSTLDEAFHIPKGKVILAPGKIQTMAKLAPEEILKRLNTYTKFTVVRHPFLRLVSAYRNKFDPTPVGRKKVPASTFYTEISLEIARMAIAEHGLHLPSFKGKSCQQVLDLIASNPQFRKLNDAGKKTVLDIGSRGCVRKITFEEFVRFGVLKPTLELTRHLDIHWRPQHMLCNPCAIDFDYVIRFENLGPESTRLLSYIQRNDQEKKRISFPAGWIPAVDNSVAREEFQRLPLDLRNRLESVFRRDFGYFGYSLTTI